MKELNRNISSTLLKRMHQFYIMFQNSVPLAHQLTWSNICELLPIKSDDERSYYINVCIKNNLSKRELRKIIKNHEYNRIDSVSNNDSNKSTSNVFELVKHPIYIKNSNNYSISEYYLKQMILGNLDSFLKELGNDFCYIGNEYKIKIGDRYNYIDILLFNIYFNCYVVIELKITEFKIEYIGQIKKYELC